MVRTTPAVPEWHAADRRGASTFLAARGRNLFADIFLAVTRDPLDVAALTLLRQHDMPQAVFPNDSVISRTEVSWHFARGPETVRLVRMTLDGQPIRLMVHGPGPSEERLEFGDVVSCVVQQCEIERELVARGFHLQRFGDRNGRRLIP